MHRFIILFVFMGIGCYAADLDKKECMKLFHPRSSRCCKSDPMKIMFKNDKDIKECFHGPKGPPPKHAHDEPGPPPPVGI
ncbi:hypothetical protein EVAR_24567_1 [Eumeta japonica]|uniref:Uncharacterized protein n=1 Tax=Eumeta variegata TaxID=151549 RepID=A0A4C1W5I5_EUMVA|nr:hypothetical protein EVAR_24567_1 [Eumeta japonica]